MFVEKISANFERDCAIGCIVTWKDKGRSVGMEMQLSFDIYINS